VLKWEENAFLIPAGTDTIGVLVVSSMVMVSGFALDPFNARIAVLGNSSMVIVSGFALGPLWLFFISFLSFFCCGLSMTGD
jgi:hypothetical protein